MKTPETAWRSLLLEAPVWTGNFGNVVLLSPHPDDEILGAGGFLAAQARSGREITIVAATDGEAAYPGVAHLASIRRGEQESALRRIGIGPHRIQRLGLPDGNLAGHEPEITRHLQSQLGPGDVLLAPWQHDWHPDHEACGRAALAAAAATGASHVSYFFWTWHHRELPALADLPLRRFDLTNRLLRLKQSALGEYRSQLHRDGAEPILPAPLLIPALRPFESFALHVTQNVPQN